MIQRKTGSTNTELWAKNPRIWEKGEERRETYRWEQGYRSGQPLPGSRIRQAASAAAAAGRPRRLRVCRAGASPRDSGRRRRERGFVPDLMRWGFVPGRKGGGKVRMGQFSIRTRLRGRRAGAWRRQGRALRAGAGRGGGGAAEWRRRREYGCVRREWVRVCAGRSLSWGRGQKLCRVPDHGTRQRHDRFAEYRDLALGKAATALPSAMLAALGKARISFQNPSIQNLFKHISLIII